MAEAYRPSGRVSSIGLPMLAAAVLIAPWLLGPVYALLSFYNPFIYITILGTGAYGFALGWILSQAVHRGRVRAPWMAWLGGLSIGIVGTWTQWIFVGGLLTGDPALIATLVNPLALASLVQVVAEQGLWNIKSHVPTGWELYTVWGLEAAIIVGLAVAGAHDAASQPYCERSDAWFQPAFSLALAPNSVTAQALRAGEVAAIPAVAATDINDLHVLEVRKAAGPPEILAARLVGVTGKVDRKGRRTESRKTLQPFVLLQAAEREALLALPSRLDTAAGVSGGAFAADDETLAGTKPI